jgi:hypothetical protein
MGVGEVGQGMVSVNLAHFFKEGINIERGLLISMRMSLEKFHEFSLSAEQINLAQCSTVYLITTRIMFHYLARSDKLPPI